MFDKFLGHLQDYMRGRGKPKNTVKDLSNLQVKTKIWFELLHANGSVTNHEFKNIVTQRASILVQKRLANHSDTPGITYFALGLGDPFGDIPDNLNDGKKWVCDAPPPAPSTGGRVHSSGKPGLVNELARKKIDVVQYLTTDDLVVGQALPVSGAATHIAAYKALFLEHEANGPIMEFALFGGKVWPDISYIPSYQTNDKGILLRDSNGKFIPNTDITSRLSDPGDMVTYKTHKLFYKTSQDRLRMTYIITIELNPEAPEAAGE